MKKRPAAREADGEAPDKTGGDRGSHLNDQIDREGDEFADADSDERGRRPNRKPAERGDEKPRDQGARSGPAGYGDGPDGGRGHIQSYDAGRGWVARCSLCHADWGCSSATCG